MMLVLMAEVALSDGGVDGEISIYLLGRQVGNILIGCDQQLK